MYQVPRFGMWWFQSLFYWMFLLKSRLKGYLIATGLVSILVLLDVPLKVLSHDAGNAGLTFVSILVLLDVPLKDCSQCRAT